MFKKTLLAGTALAALAGATFAYAQNAAPDTKAPPQRPQFTAEDRAAFLDARIAGVKAALKLTPEQEKNWPAAEKAARDFAAQRMKAREARRSTDQSKLDPLERMRLRATNMAEMADGLKKLVDAAEPLYKSLDDNQKRRLQFAMHQGGRGHGHHRGFHRGHHGGRWGDDGFGPGTGRGNGPGPGNGPGMGPGGMGPGGMGPGGMGPDGMGPGGGRL